ncbi:MAG: elongation factor G [Actinobacteria bacterium]|nr:elongation factor G [Actinomycetota bacterium]MCL6095945.1 elongation factor G [Actinomycetota bacterium]
MKSYPPRQMRNIALIGHNGAGKTTLAEAILFQTGTISRLGKVEDGTTTMDFEPEELKRHISISLASCPVEVNGYKITMIDTPGYGDFIAEVKAALEVVEAVILVVSAVEGVEVQTEVVWELADKLGVPRLIFLNKLDRERADYERSLRQLRDSFGPGVAPMQIPIGEESTFSGVADLLTEEAVTYDSAGVHLAPIPDELRESEATLHEQLVEGIVASNDELMERYLDGELPEHQELYTAMKEGVSSCSVFPLLCGSATGMIGIDRLVKFICDVLPSPLERPPITIKVGDHSQHVSVDPNGDPLAMVYKTITDPYVGKISQLKVVSGILRPDVTLINSRTKTEERLHTLEVLKGKETEPVPEAQAGDLIAVPKLADVYTGDTLAPKGSPVKIELAPLEPPVLSMAIKPKAKADEDKLMAALHKLQEEDPALQVARIDETHQTLIMGTGDAHLTVTCERLQRKFGVEVETEPVLVPYRETITKQAEAEGKYKKQTGGHGQFGVANLRIAPLARGEGFRFVDEIVGGAIPRQFIPAVEKGVIEAMESGGVYGYPVVDVEVTCYDGKYHPVDSSEMSFKMAGALAFKEALAKAGPVLLEPISRIVVTVPSAYQGEVMGDLNGRRGRISGTEPSDDGKQSIIALVPTSEVQHYATDLRSMTGGRGRFSLTHDHYDIVPPQLADKLARPAKEGT